MLTGKLEVGVFRIEFPNSKSVKVPVVKFVAIPKIPVSYTHLTLPTSDLV